MATLAMHLTTEKIKVLIILKYSVATFFEHHHRQFFKPKAT